MSQQKPVVDPLDDNSVRCQNCYNFDSNGGYYCHYLKRRPSVAETRVGCRHFEFASPKRNRILAVLLLLSTAAVMALVVVPHFR